MARATTLSSVKIALNGVEGPKWFKAGDSSIYIGYVVHYEDADEVKVMPIDQLEAAGIAGCPSYKDNTTVFAENDRVPVWLCGCGAEVWATHDAAASSEVHINAYVAFSLTTAGLVVDTFDPWGIVSAAGAQIAQGGRWAIGRCTRAISITSATKQNIRLLLNI